MKIKLMFLLIILSSSTVISDNPVTLDLVEGRNVVFVSDYFPSRPVSVFVFDNPSVESVTLNQYGQSFGFVRVFGGVGTDFLFMYDQEYEVFVSSDVSLVLS